MAKAPRSLKNRRKESWQRFKQLRRELGRRHELVQQAWQNYSLVNRSYRAYSLNFQCSYEEKLVELLKTAPKALHSYLRGRKIGCPSVGPLRGEDGSLVADQHKMGDLFAEAFCSVYQAATPSNPHEHQTTDARMDEFFVDYDCLLAKLLEMNPSSSPGPDGLHPRLLKACAQVLVQPLCLILRKSLNDGILPGEWKFSRVVPIL